MNTKIITINLIQDLATPHNNVLIRHFVAYPNVRIKLWYARDQDLGRYQWATNITHEHFPAEIYGTAFNWAFIKYCLTHPDERYVIVGWMNANTLLLHLLFLLFRRPYNHWTDLPKSDTGAVSLKRRFTRWLSYKTLRHSNSKVFGVGLITLNYFKNLGFTESSLVNLPIFVDSDENLPAYRALREHIFNKYAIQAHHFVLSAGSRIIYEKGYDLLVKSIGLLAPAILQNIRVIIVGSGDNVPLLEDLIKTLGLSEQIILEKWLAIEDFKALIANSDVFMHPARTDSYGGTTLGMALGVPVIGSYGAGAAVDRIEHGRNGFLYEAEDIKSLASFITQLYKNPDLRKRMGNEALKTAKAWPPSRGVQILVDHTI
jgi:glycosyltransferase involved in cell wall biosynthesis